jgi:multiple antibiotic resistance protein
VIVEALRDSVSLFIIVSPLGAVPLYLGMTASDAPERRRRTAWIAAITTTLTLGGAALVGQQVFDFFGVSVDAFRIAGGVLLFLYAIDFVQVRQPRMKTTDPEFEDGVAKEETGVIPLGIPMLAGPGAIATTLVLATHAGGSWLGLVPLLIAVLVVGTATALVLLAAARLQHVLTPSVLGIVLRLEGLLLGAISVQMTVTGVTGLVLETARRG